MSETAQSQVNIGLVGHVDSGKTTIVKALTGKWADTHSEELKRGITIRLGYADLAIRECPKCNMITAEETCTKCGGKTKVKRRVSFVDAPGHETLMTVMISSSAIMDGAMLIIAANEPCPQPQTYEHFKALEIMGIKKVVVVQNKIDLVSKKDALQNYKEIKKFLKGTFAENAPIVPIAAHQKINLDQLCKTIEEHIPTPQRDNKKPVMMFTARSFDVNKPGTKIQKMAGGVIGGSIIQGELKKGDQIELRPGIKIDGEWKIIQTEIESINVCNKEVKKASPGGLAGVRTTLDPSLTKSDTLVGNICGKPDALPPVMKELTLEAELMDRVIGMEEVKPLKPNEPLVVTTGTAMTIGTVSSLHPLKIKLKNPVCADKGWKASLSRLIGNRWRLVGHGKIV